MSGFLRAVKRRRGPLRCGECGADLYLATYPGAKARTFCNNCGGGKPLPPDMLAAYRKAYP